MVFLILSLSNNTPILFLLSYHSFLKQDAAALFRTPSKYSLHADYMDVTTLVIINLL